MIGDSCSRCERVDNSTSSWVELCRFGHPLTLTGLKQDDELYHACTQRALLCGIVFCLFRNTHLYTADHAWRSNLYLKHLFYVSSLSYVRRLTVTCIQCRPCRCLDDRSDVHSFVVPVCRLIIWDAYKVIRHWRQYSTCRHRVTEVHDYSATSFKWYEVKPTRQTPPHVVTSRFGA